MNFQPNEGITKELSLRYHCSFRGCFDYADNGGVVCYAV